MSLAPATKVQRRATPATSSRAIRKFKKRDGSGQGADQFDGQYGVLELGRGGVHERAASTDEKAEDAMEKNVEAERKAQKQHGKRAVLRVGGIRRRGRDGGHGSDF
jgi:hypothetical protein